MSMTESEAIRRLKDHFRVHDDGRPTPYLDEAVSMAISALEEVQRYRAIGTVSEFQELKEKATAKASYGIKCPHCNFYTSNGRYCCNCGKMLVAKSEGKE